MSNRGWWALALCLLVSCGGEAVLEPDSATAISIAPRAGTGRASALHVEGEVTGGLATSEAGATATFTLRLTAAPTDDVVVAVASSDTTEGSISTGALLTFTAANWATPQNVVISGVNDLVADGDQQYTVSYTTTSNDTRYNGINMTLFLVTNRDNDRGRVRIVSDGLTTSKTGLSDSFTVALVSEPTGSVTIAVSASDGNASAALSASSLTFTTGNWATPQTVTLTGQPNVVQGPANGGTSYYIHVGPNTSADAQYASMPTLRLMATHVDTEQHQMTIVAGQIGGSGSLDAQGSAARFGYISGIVFDRNGNALISDEDASAIRKVTPGGVVSTFAGMAYASGTTDGPGPSARFYHPKRLAIDTDGNVYVADSGNDRIRKITPAGLVTTFAGGGVHYSDGTGTAASFYMPYGLAFDASGNLFVSDYGNKVIRKIDPSAVVTTLAGMPGVIGSSNGTGSGARFWTPSGLAVDSAGNLFVADVGTSIIRKVTSAGVVTTFAGTVNANGTTDGVGAAARFSGPRDLVIDTTGTMYVPDTYGSAVRRITAAGAVTTIAGMPWATGAVDGTGNAARFLYPEVLAIHGTDVYVGDRHLFRKVSSDAAVTTVAGRGESRGSTDASGTNARFDLPRAVTTDSNGVTYVADGNYVLRKVTATGVVTRFAGDGSPGTTDGPGTAASFNEVLAMAVDPSGNVYVGDSMSDFGSYTAHSSIRRVTPAGVVSTLIGPSFGTSDGTGSDAQFYFPRGLAIDNAGNLYVSDTADPCDFSSCSSMVRKVTPTGVVTTVAGMAETQGTEDGTGSDARFQSAAGIVIGDQGDLFVVDGVTIRRVTTAGVVTTIAGLAGTLGFADGVGTAARFGQLGGVAGDRYGNIYVADTNNHCIRKVTPAGVVTTILGAPGQIGAYPTVITDARLSYPSALSVFGDAIIVLSENAVLRAAKIGGW